MFKLVEGKDGTTSFLPIDDETGGEISYIQNKEAMCLAEKQKNYVYKKGRRRKYHQYKNSKV